MKRSMFGTLPLVAAALLASCGDPTGDLRTGASVRVTPGFLTINVNAAESVIVQLVDDQGNALEASFSAASNNAAVATVGENVNFRPGLGQNKLAGRFGISALAIDSTSITFTAGGRSATVPVLVAPLNAPIVLNPAAPNVNDLVTVTAAGFKFHPNAGVVFGGFPQFVTAVAADSSSATFRATNAGSGFLTLQNIAVGYLPGIPATFLSATSETFGPGITALTGTDAIATAPAVPLNPDPTLLSQLNDVGVFSASADCTGGPSGAPCRIYAVTTAGADFDVTATWAGGQDLGVYFTDISNADVFPGFACDAHPSGATASPETCTVSLTAGTYYMQVGNFSGTSPADFNIVLQSH